MKILVVLFVLLSGTMAEAQVKFVTKDWDSLLKAAKEENKYIYVDGYTDWCGWCKVLDKKTFSDTAVGDFMNAHFIPIKMDMEKEGCGKKIALKYVIDFYPNGLVFNSDGKLIYEIGGYSPPNNFIKLLTEAIKVSSQFDLKGFGNGFGVTYPSFYVNAMAENGKRKLPKEKEVNDYLDGKKNKFSETAWVVWKRFADMLDNDNKKFFLSNYKRFGELYGSQDVNDIINGFIYKMVDGAGDSKDQKAFDAAMTMADAYLLQPGLEKARYESIFYDKTGNWEAYDQSIKDQMQLDTNMTGDVINEIAWNIYQHCADSIVIQDAINWMAVAIKKEPEYNSMDTYAALLYKAKKYNDANAAALKAIETGKANHEDVGSTEKLLANIKGHL